MGSCLHPLSFWEVCRTAGAAHIAICVCLFGTAIIQEVCQRYGGCLRKGPWEPGLMVMMVLRCERRSV